MSEHSDAIYYQADQLWRADGWQAGATFGVSAAGGVLEDADGTVESIGRWVLPGMPNLHSHAFQRAMAGLAERKGKADDSFWSWREAMYAFAAAIGPDELQAIAAQLYVEMLKAGYTQVCEFHYLHHQPDGTPYARAGSDVAGADRGGARSRHRPDPAAGAVHERRLRRPRAVANGSGASVMTWTAICACWNACRRTMGDDLRVGIALHSLRAVPEHAMREVLASPLASRLPDPHPHRRADRRSAGLPRHAQRAAGRVAARPRAMSMRAGASCMRRI